jgi:acyl-coenzyme A thioesterase PaaI-like protein
MLESNTHLAIDPDLVGTPVALAEGEAIVELEASGCMAADHRGLVHGGFVFGLADYAAMLAVNDPLVVLGAADTTFKKPVRVGETIRAEAKVTESKGKKRAVAVVVRRGEEVVMEGSFTCFVLESHVLDRRPEGGAR